MTEPKARTTGQRRVGTRERRGSVVSCSKSPAESVSPTRAAPIRILRPNELRRGAVTSRKRREAASATRPAGPLKGSRGVRPKAPARAEAKRGKAEPPHGGERSIDPLNDVERKVDA